MAEIEISPDYVRMLSLKVGALAGKEPPHYPDPGSNATDDPLSVIEEDSEDQSREEVIEEIGGLSPREQAELVALMWLGRDDGDAEDWDDLVQQAVERKEVPTAQYLLDHPLLSEFWLSGLDKLDLGSLDSGVEEI
jgi:hypothetical protein